mmetsp:Transcript_33783/g.99435  ORF Transcript_33783/g.99435 Transcript_33783/m.99435 type:complete len:192 (-) Transcript_33783:289-864(-)
MKELETKLAEGLARESAQREELQREMERRFKAAEAALLSNVRMVLLILHGKTDKLESICAVTKEDITRLTAELRDEQTLQGWINSAAQVELAALEAAVQLCQASFKECDEATVAAAGDGPIEDDTAWCRDFFDAAETHLINMRTNPAIAHFFSPSAKNRTSPRTPMLPIPSNLLPAAEAPDTDSSDLAYYL